MRTEPLPPPACPTDTADAAAECGRARVQEEEEA